MKMEGLDRVPVNHPDYFKTVYNQAISLFNELFLDEDKILLVTNVYPDKDYIRSKRKMKVYSHYIKNKDVRVFCLLLS